MKSISIDVAGQIDLYYDANSKEFKEALEGYNKVINPNSDAKDMLKHVAFYITRFGVYGMVEGVGYVLPDGRKPTEDEEPFSGIWVSPNFDDFDFEINPY